MTASAHPINCVLIASLLLLVGCSGSGVGSPAEDAEPITPGNVSGDSGGVPAPAPVEPSVVAPQLIPDSENLVNDDDPDTDNEPPALVEVELPVVVADPMVQNSTHVTFNITVPAYRSDALQVAVEWGDIYLTANWVGDEFWSVSNDFPTDTQNPLTITFSDDNGEVPLGTFETQFKTGTNTTEVVSVTADQFDTERWDNDNDGASNLSELIAGTNAFGVPVPQRILLFHETRGYRHDSITTALMALEELASSVDIETDTAADSAGIFTGDNLANYAAVVWVLTSGDVLNASEQLAFENYIRSGGGYAGIHAASDTEYDWPWYGELVGAYFKQHPEIQFASQTVENNTHASTAHLGDTWSRTDEWYDFNTNPRSRVNVLLTLDETSYSGGGMGEDHPIAWYHEYDGGRSWYTGGGHTNTSYAEPDFRAHLLGGLTYVVGLD